MIVLLLLAKFLVGGTFVVAFAIISEAVRPSTISGLFAAAPSIALANLGITFASQGPTLVRDEGAGMIAGSIGMLAYVLASEPAIRRGGSLIGSLGTLLVWLAVAVGGYAILQAAA